MPPTPQTAPLHRISGPPSDLYPAPPTPSLTRLPAFSLRQLYSPKILAILHAPSTDIDRISVRDIRNALAETHPERAKGWDPTVKEALAEVIRAVFLEFTAGLVQGRSAKESSCAGSNVLSAGRKFSRPSTVATSLNRSHGAFRTFNPQVECGPAPSQQKHTPPRFEVENASRPPISAPSSSQKPTAVSTSRPAAVESATETPASPIDSTSHPRTIRTSALTTPDVPISGGLAGHPTSTTEAPLQPKQLLKVNPGITEKRKSPESDCDKSEDEFEASFMRKRRVLR